MLPRAAAGADHTNGSLLAPAKAGVRNQERSLQVHSLPAPGGFQPGEDEQPICSHLLRNTTGRGQQGQPGYRWALGEDPGGHSHLAGRAGRHLERRHAGGKDLGTSRIACPRVPPPPQEPQLRLPCLHPYGWVLGRPWTHLGSPGGRGQRHLSIPLPSGRAGRVEASWHPCRGSGFFSDTPSF